jgi:myo-inositol-1(or 4)-monophosphatase
MPGDYATLLETARRVALEAADLVREGGRRTVVVAGTKSSPVDVVTEVDKAAERLIFDRLMALRPGDGFLGEEGSRSDAETGISWLVDPIDGTVNFLYGIPQYSLSIAALAERRSVAGVVVDVVRGEVFEATLGGGARCDGRRLAVRPPAPMEQRLVLTGFNYVEEVRVRQADAAARMLREVRDIRRLGSAALDLCAVGAGRADGYVEEGLNPWDGAAGGLVATEAGATMQSRPGVGGTDCVLCAPADGFAEFSALVERCGFLAEPDECSSLDRE